MAARYLTIGEESYKYKKKEHQNELYGDGLESEVSMLFMVFNYRKEI